MEERQPQEGRARLTQNPTLEGLFACFRVVLDGNSTGEFLRFGLFDSQPINLPETPGDSPTMSEAAASIHVTTAGGRTAGE